MEDYITCVKFFAFINGELDCSSRKVLQIVKATYDTKAEVCIGKYSISPSSQSSSM